MGIPDGAHTHGSGGGLGTALLVLVGAALAVKLAGPVVAAVSQLVYVLIIVVTVAAGAGAAGAVGVLIWRWRHPRPIAPRVASPPVQARAAQAFPAPQRRAIEAPGQVHIHHHWHGVTAEEVAAIIRHQEARDE
jgi:hypothetical protein